MATKRISQNKLAVLFLKKVKKKDLPKLDHSEDLEEDKREQALIADISRFQHEMEKIEAPLFTAELKQRGVSLDDYKKIMEQRKEWREKHIEKFEARLDLERWEPPYSLSETGWVLEGPDLPECTEIPVRVCQERVCVDTDLPISIDELYRTDGSNGTFQKHGNDGFEAYDRVEGYSTWNLTYHRHKRYDRGWVNIHSSTELVEPAVVKGIGVNFEQLVHANGETFANGGKAWGDIHISKPNSWGRAEKYKRIRVEYKKPGEPWVRWHWPQNRTRYFHHYNEQEMTSAGFANNMWGPHWPDEVIGSNNRGSVTEQRTGNFSAGTQFRVYVQLKWKIYGNGDNGVAKVHYGLRAKPFITIEACSYEYPESVTIDLSDYGL